MRRLPPTPQAEVTSVAAAAAPAAARPQAAPRERRLRPATVDTNAELQPAVADTGPAAESAATVPVYATQLPPPVTLRYALRRGTAQGHAELRWQPDGLGYTLSLRSEGLGRQALGSASSGRLDAHGLAPERHTDSRRGRDVRAVNFQRDSARITFSGAGNELPLVDGAQDRLSWMLQLAAIVEANPALRLAGSEIRVFVVGSRGDGETWVYSVVGPEALDLPAGAVAQALHLTREPRRLYDTQVEVWLDPARHHLPVRAQMRLRATGEGTEWLLEEAVLP